MPGLPGAEHPLRGVAGDPPGVFGSLDTLPDISPLGVPDLTGVAGLESLSTSGVYPVVIILLEQSEANMEFREIFFFLDKVPKEDEDPPHQVT